jgi:hypothetical protein
VLAGEILSLSGKCPELTFTIRGQRIVTTKSTDYPGKGDCKDVKSGKGATVDGIRQTDGSVRASTVAVQKGEHDDDAIQQ